MDGINKNMITELKIYLQKNINFELFSDAGVEENVCSNLKKIGAFIRI